MNPLQKSIILCVGGFFAAATSPIAQAKPAGKSLPNIVFILADDLGWADPGRYHEHHAGGAAPVPTPNINRLCDEGMMFTDAQLPASLCAPNRFCLLTGNYTQRSREAGTWNRTASSGFHFATAPDDRIGTPHRTIGQVLQDAGYRTGFFGKMHVGGDFFDAGGNLLRDLANDQLGQIDFSRRFRNGLLDHGFDYTFVNPDGIQGPLYAWFENDLYRAISSFEAEVDGVAPGPASVLKDFTAGETVGHGEILADGYGDSRFDSSAHGPILSHFAVKFIQDHVASHPGEPFMIYYASPAIHVPLTPSADGLVAAGATGLGDRSDFVYDLDLQVGRLLKALKQLGIEDNTLIVFSSDNGGYEGGAAPNQDPNGPLRAAKGSIYEGGHRVPFIWKWGDGTVKGSVIPPGVVCNQLVSVIDWVPSIVDLMGGAVGGDQHQDSVSLLPLVFSDAPDAVPAVRTRHFYYAATSGNRAARLDDAEGKWFYVRSNAGAPIELYDLASDRSQTTNLVEGYATIASLPSGHPHKARIQDMESWYLAHNGANDPRSEEALNYAPAAGDDGTRSVSVNFNTTGTQAVSTPYGVVPSSNWPSIPTPFAAAAAGANLQDDTGSPTTLDMAMTAPGSPNFFGAAYTGTPLHSGPAFYNQSNNTIMTIREIPYTSYDVIVYLTGFLTNTGASVSDGTTTYYWQTANPANATLVRTTNTAGTGIPAANYAIFSGLSGASKTFTFTHISGGGGGVGGVQIVGSGPAGPSFKTPIPVPVPTPRVALDPTDFSLAVTGLESDVSYIIQSNSGLAGPWTPSGTIPSGSNGTWNGVVATGGPREFFQLAYPAKTPRATLPLTVP